MDIGKPNADVYSEDRNYHPKKGPDQRTKTITLEESSTLGLDIRWD